MALCHLWKVLANRREMPEDWRIASVTPVFQKCKKADLGSYRLLSLTSIPRKMMEQLVLDAIFKQLEEKVIKSSKHGFIKGKSYLINLVTFYDVFTSWLDMGRTVNVLYLDLSKA